MTQFGNKQQNKRPGINNSIDGFGSSGRIGRSNRPGRLDNFNRGEGFVPRNRSVGGGFGDAKTNISSAKTQTGSEADVSSASLAAASAATRLDDEPVLIDKGHASGRRSLWSRLRRKGKPPMSRKRKILTGAAIFLTIVALIFGFLILKGYINLNKVLGGGGGAAALEANVDPSKLRGEGDGRINILLLGRGGEGNDAPDLTDTIILASIDPIAKEAALVSIPRDLYVPVSGQGSMKINAVYSIGKNAAIRKTSRTNNDSRKQAEEAGFSLLEETFETTFGVPIHYRATIDFSGFRQAVDTVGGVNVNVPTAVRENMRIDGKSYKLDVKPGQQQMDGFKALAYSRSRYTSARGDFDRSERQRLIILALKEKVLSAGTFSNPTKISGLLDTLGNHVQTNFSAQDLARLLELGKQIPQSKISSIGLADPPNNYVVTDTIGGQSVVVPRAGIGNFKEIQGYLRNALKDSFIRNENASIAVYNGTDAAGLATTKADELKSFGYNITTVGNAPTKGNPKTILVDLRAGSKKYTKGYLEKRFGVSSVASLPDATIQPGTADFVIILGSDQSNSGQTETSD